MSRRRYMVVTLDAEVDKDRYWRVARPASFRSITQAIPEVLSPLFGRYGARPTYLLSPEVIEDDEARAVLGDLSEVELGTHLHTEFVAPQRTLIRATMAGHPTNQIQATLPSDIEQAKLANLTQMFTEAFGRRPTAFRAGRFGLGKQTLSALAALGYLVDSSVTPGIRWAFEDLVVDFRSWSNHPTWLSLERGSLLELPVSVYAQGPFANLLQLAPGPIGRIARRVVRPLGDFSWLRPSWQSGAQLIRHVQNDPNDVVVMMLHSVEVVLGASPYSQSALAICRITDSMDELFDFWTAAGFGFCTMSEATRLVPRP